MCVLQIFQNSEIIAFESLLYHDDNIISITYQYFVEFSFLHSFMLMLSWTKFWLNRNL
jgi:hypothetical protein